VTLSAWLDRTRQGNSVLARCLRYILDAGAELSRIELVDRSLALGAQALLALIPLLMVLSVASGNLGAAGLDQVQDVMGVREQQVKHFAVEAQEPTATSVLSVVVAIISATSFSRALQRMYARAWHLPRYRGLRAIGGSLLWLAVWIVMLQGTAGLIRWSAGIPFSSVTIQLVGTSLTWWWTARILLGRRVSWIKLLPGGIVTGVSLVLFSRLSHVFMPAFTDANLEQFGPLGLVFAVASWLVMFGGVVMVATVLGRLVSGFVTPVRAVQPTRMGRRFRLRA
jgi:membrane protein